MPVYEFHNICVESDLPLSLRAATGVPDGGVVYRLKLTGTAAPIRMARNCSVVALKRWANGAPSVSVLFLPEDLYIVRIHLWMEFIIRNRTIECRLLRHASLSEIDRIATGLVLGWLLRHEGYIALHCSAVHCRANGRTIGFVGRSGSGKSTLSAYLVRQGCAMITDDILCLKPGSSAAAEAPRRLLLARGCADVLGIPYQNTEVVSGKLNVASSVDWFGGLATVTDIVVVERQQTEAILLEPVVGDVARKLVEQNVFPDFVAATSAESRHIDRFAHGARIHRLTMPLGRVDPHIPVAVIAGRLL